MRARHLWIALAFGVMLSTFTMVAQASGGGGDKITICHVPPGNPGNAHSIRISRKAWNEGHSEHKSHVLDYLGECRVDPTPVPTSTSAPEPTPVPTSTSAPEPTSTPSPEMDCHNTGDGICPGDVTPRTPPVTVTAAPTEQNACQIEACSLCEQLDELNATLLRIAVALEEANE